MGSLSSIPGGWGLVWTGRHGHAYDEPVFRYLLALERTRSARLGLPLLLLLVEPSPPAPRIATTPASRLFSVLSACTRETDIVGWHRRDRVAGVAITELGDSSLAEVSACLQAKVAAALGRELPVSVPYHVYARIHGRPRPTGSIGAAADVGTGESECSISA